MHRGFHPRGGCVPVRLCDMTATVPRASPQEAKAARGDTGLGWRCDGHSEKQQRGQECVLPAAGLNRLTGERGHVCAIRLPRHPLSSCFSCLSRAGLLGEEQSRSPGLCQLRSWTAQSFTEPERPKDCRHPL